MSSITDSNHGLPSIPLIVDVSILVSALVLGLFFNGALIISVKRNRRLWTLTNGLLTCEAVANLSVLGLAIPIHLAAVLLYPMPIPKLACVVHSALHFGGHLLSSGIYASVAYLRYLTICSGKTCLLRRRRLLLWVSPPCVIALLSTFIKFFLSPQNIFCLHRHFIQSPTQEWFNTIPFILFFLVILYSFSRITYAFIQSRFLSVPNISTISSSQRRHKAPKHRLRVDMVTTLSCLSHALFSIFNYIPTKLFTIFAFHTIHDEENWTVVFSLILSFDHALLAMVDPFLFIFICKEVRDEIVAILLCTSKSRKKNNQDQFTDVISRVKFKVRKEKQTEVTHF